MVRDWKHVVNKVPDFFTELRGRAEHFFHTFTALKAAKILVLALLTVFPFQIRTLLFQTSFFPTGNFHEYTVFFLYLGDIVLLGALASYGIAIWKGEVSRDFHYGFWPITMLLLALLALFWITVPFAEMKAVAFWKAVRFSGLFGLYFLLVNEVVARREALRFFVYGMLIQAGIAVVQYIVQSSLGLHLLGEPFLSTSKPGVAKVDFEGGTFLRAYGTLSHPNVLGGLVVAAIFWAYYIFRKNLWLLMGIGSLLLLALLFTFSRSAFLALGGGGLFFFSISEKRIRFQQVLLWGSILLFFIISFHLENVLVERVFLGNDPGATLERIEYLSISRFMLMDHPFGVGLGHFTLLMQDFSAQNLDPWLLQPVHNVYLLMMNEGGVLAGVLFIGLLGTLFVQLLGRIRDNNKDEQLFAYLALTVLMTMALIMLFDHYFYTLYAGQVFLFFYLGLVSSSLNKPLLPRKNS